MAHDRSGRRSRNWRVWLGRLDEDRHGGRRDQAVEFGRIGDAFVVLDRHGHDVGRVAALVHWLLSGLHFDVREIKHCRSWPLDRLEASARSSVRMRCSLFTIFVS